MESGYRTDSENASSPSKRSPFTTPTSAGLFRRVISFTTIEIGVRPGLMSATFKYSEPKSTAIMEAWLYPASSLKNSDARRAMASILTTEFLEIFPHNIYRYIYRISQWTLQTNGG
jgi:hypothetical protein